MTSFPGSPLLLKGALIAGDPFNPIASIVAFQYNPETMTRKLSPRSKGGEGAQGEALRLEGPPRETITLALQIDATDALEKADPLATGLGISPALAALEMMVYPKSALVVANIVLAAIGTIEILPASAPLVLFVWGPTRVLPVRIGDITITEEEYDTRLNPMRAKVDLSLEVLSYADLEIGTAGHALFLAHQFAKEALAVTGSVGSLARIGI